MKERVTSVNPDKASLESEITARTRAEQLPSWITNGFIERTTKLFQSKYLSPLPRTDVIKILVNVGALLDAVLSRGPHDLVPSKDS